MTRSISIIIPAYNEERRLPATLVKLADYLEQTKFDFSEIVVVDDGSTDATAQMAERQDGAVRLLRNPGNRGKGYSVRHGMLEARGEWLLFTDADLSSPIEELNVLWDAVEKNGAQVAFGSRAINRKLVGVHQPKFRENMGRFFNLVVRLVSGLPYLDTQCGFKLFERGAAQKIFRQQRSDGFGFDVEVLFLASHLGFRAVEVPVRWNDVQGTRVSPTRGLAAFLDPFRVRWNQLTGKYQ